jgi:phosphoglycolate phosphatase
MAIYVKSVIMNIFFDLDGTLIDSRERLYFLFQHLVKESDLSFDEYWKYKRSKISHRDILLKIFRYSDHQISVFEEKWMLCIEEKEWLVFDKPFEGVLDYLNSIRKKHVLFLITARQSKVKTIEQLDRLGFLDVFERVFITGQKLEKYDLIANVINLSKEDWFVGDTGKDIQTGKKLGMRTAAVLSGFLSKESLLEYYPDLIATDVMKLSFG